MSLVVAKNDLVGMPLCPQRTVWRLCTVAGRSQPASILCESVFEPARGPCRLYKQRWLRMGHSRNAYARIAGKWACLLCNPTGKKFLKYKNGTSYIGEPMKIVKCQDPLCK